MFQFKPVVSICEKMEFFLRLYGIVLRILYIFVQPILYLIFIGFAKHEKLPGIKNPLLNIPAVDLAEKIRNKEVIVNHNFDFQLIGVIRNI